MNIKQLNYTLDRLGWKGARRDAVKMILIDKMKAYNVEPAAGIPAGTGNRHARKAKAVWLQMTIDAMFVDESNKALKE